jgi:hypothetical protein
MATKKKAKKATKAQKATAGRSAKRGKKTKVATRAAGRKPAAKPARSKRPAAKKAKAQARSTKKPARATAAKSARAHRPVAKAKPRTRAATPLRREDRAGHLDPRYVAELRSRSDRPAADPAGFVNRPRSKDDLVEELAEEYVSSVNSGEYNAEDRENQNVPEEVGGPFVTTSERQEFAEGTDASNPKGATREPFPRT